MLPIKNYKQEKITFDFAIEVSDRLKKYYASLAEFINKIKDFNSALEKNRDFYNINPYSDKLNRGIYILAKDGSELQVFPNSNLALKCSQGKLFTDNLKTQFERTIQLTIDFENKFNEQEKAFLKICPVYAYFKTNEKDVFFQQILFMENVEGGKSLGDTITGFSSEFCRIFQIPSLEEIKQKPQFRLHLLLDKNTQRQLLKIQTTYLFRRLLARGILILSLNQKNILISQENHDAPIQYTIIDPTVDWVAPLSPMYNLTTFLLCQ
jgi:hypothetical protein